jgi:hypothetical protein
MSRSPLRSECASAGRGSLDVHPCTFANGRASCAPSFGLIRPALAATKGARRSRADQEQRKPLS